MLSSATQEMASQFPSLRRTVAGQMAGYRERLAERIDSELSARSWGAERLSQESGVSEKTINRLRRSEHDPRPSTLRRLSEGLGLKPDALSPEVEAGQLERLEEKLDVVVRWIEAQEALEAGQIADEIEQSVDPEAQQDGAAENGAGHHSADG